jgi:hypothetical protein
MHFSASRRDAKSGPLKYDIRQMAFKPRRAREIPSREALFLPAQGPVEFRDASEARVSADPSEPSFSCSRKTNSGGVRSWLRPGGPSELHALRRADQGNCRNTRCTRTVHICEGGATSLPSSGNLHNRLPWVSNLDLRPAELFSSRNLLRRDSRQNRHEFETPDRSGSAFLLQNYARSMWGA